MTPTEEAEHALDSNIHYSRISRAAQAEYHRIKGERAAANGRPRSELSNPAERDSYDRVMAEKNADYQPEDDKASAADWKTESRRALKDAREALEEGRKVFLVRIPMMYDRVIALGTAGLPGPSSLVEAIEELGWRLDQMSWVPRPASAFRAEGIFLFRREAR